MQKVKLNIVPKGVKRATYLSQNDNGRVVRYELFNELVPYTLDGSETITVKVVRPDGVEIVSSVPNTEAAYIDVTFNDDMSAIAGVGAGEIKITDGETVLGSHNFDINVEIDAYNGKDVVIETASGTLAEFDTEVEDNALEYESEIPYNAEGYTGLRVINSRTAPVFNKTPYLFRKTPSGSGNNCLEELNGLSVAYNQLVQNGNFTDTSVWQIYNASSNVSSNIISVTATEQWGGINQSETYIVGHKYLFTAEINTNGNSACQLWFGASDKFISISSNENAFIRYNMLFNAGSTGTAISITDMRAENFTEYKVKNVNLFDLTAMLGSTIADYLYNLETQTAGAGVSLFKSLGFNAPYYPYNIGSLLSSIPVAKRVIGKNLFNKNGLLTAHYFINSDGTLTASSEWNVTDYEEIVSGNYTMSGETDSGSYYCICWYDSSKNYISGYSIFTRNPTTVEIPQGARYVRYTVHNTALDTFMLEYGSEATVYEPYKETFINLGGDALRGLLKLDSNNNIYAYGDIKTSDGKITRRFNIVDLGSLTYVKQEFYNSKYGFLAYLTDIKPVSSPIIKANMICDPYITDTGNNVYLGNEGISMWSTENRISIYDSSLESLTKEQFKAAMSGKYLIYEIETPTIESSTPFNSPQVSGSIEQVIDGNFYGVVDLGSINWSNASTTTYGAKEHHAYNQTYIKPVSNNNIVFNAYITNDLNIASANAGYSNAITDCITVDTGSNLYIYSEKYENMDSEQFKAAMSGVYLYYEKSDSAGVEIPLGHNSIYGTDIEHIDIDFNTTIYGGEIDAVNGVLSSEYNSDGSVKPTPEIIDITPTPIPVRAGDNKIFNSANGNQTIRYYNQVEE